MTDVLDVITCVRTCTAWRRGADTHGDVHSRVIRPVAFAAAHSYETGIYTALSVVQSLPTKLVVFLGASPAQQRWRERGRACDVITIAVCLWGARGARRRARLAVYCQRVRHDWRELWQRPAAAVRAVRAAVYPRTYAVTAPLPPPPHLQICVARHADVAR